MIAMHVVLEDVYKKVFVDSYQHGAPLSKGVWKLYKHFLKMTTHIYSNLVRYFFFTNLTFEGSIMWSQGKDVDLQITLELWKEIYGLKYEAFPCRKNLMIQSDCE